MGKRDDLIRRLCARPPEARFSDVRQLLEIEGFTLNRTKGSHNSFVKSGELPIVVPTKQGRTVSRVYLDDICKQLGLDEE
jgi:predicted RNA binding protein YcfA (HicA-like mRNA interferase family)